jgi:hypothetical protein
MKPDWELLADLTVFLDLEPDEQENLAAAFDHLGFPCPAGHYGLELVWQLMVELERRRERGLAIREYGEDGLGLLYYEVDAADGDEDTRALASERFVREVAGGISASFVGPWPRRARIIASPRFDFRSSVRPRLFRRTWRIFTTE